MGNFREGKTGRAGTVRSLLLLVKRTPTPTTQAQPCGRDLSHIYEIATPFLRFSQLLQDAITLDEESLHVSTQEYLIYNSAENSQWRLKLEKIIHLRTCRMLQEFVIVFHALECACDHDVLEMLRIIEFSHSNSQSLF